MRSNFSPALVGIRALPLLLLAAGALAVAASPAAASVPPPATGDWVVSEDTALDNQTILLNGSLSVVNGSVLTLWYVELTFNHSTYPQPYITVEAGAQLVLRGTFFHYNPATVTSLNGAIGGVLDCIESGIDDPTAYLSSGERGLVVDGGTARFNYCFDFAGGGAIATVKGGGSLEILNSTFYNSSLEVTMAGNASDPPSQFRFEECRFGPRGVLRVGTIGNSAAPQVITVLNVTHATTVGTTFMLFTIRAAASATIAGVNAQGPGSGYGLWLEVLAPFFAAVADSRFEGFTQGMRVDRPATDTTLGAIELRNLDLNGTEFGLRIEGNTSAHLAFPINVSGSHIASDNTALGIFRWRATVENCTLWVRQSFLALWIIEAIVTLQQVEHNTSAILHDARGYPYELFEAYWDAPLQIVWKEGGAPPAGWNASLVLRVGGPYFNGTVDALGHIPGAPARLLLYRLVENSTFDLDARLMNGTLSRFDRPSITFSQPITGNLTTYLILVHDPTAPEIVLLDPAWPKAFNTTTFTVRVGVFDPETGIYNWTANFDRAPRSEGMGLLEAHLEFEVSLTVARDGSYRLFVNATDLAGNRAFDTFYVEVDRVPARSFDSDPYEGEHVNRTRFNLTISCEWDIVSVVVDGAAASSVPPPIPVGGIWNVFAREVSLPEGPHTFLLTIVDHAGNVAFFTLNVTVDATPPNPTILGIIDGHYYNRSSLPVRIELNEPSGVQIDGHIVGPHNLTVQWNIGLDLAVSSHEIIVWDSAANSVTYTFLVFLDLEAPILRFASGVSVERAYVASTSVQFDLITSLDSLYVSDGEHQWNPNAAGAVHIALALEPGEHELHLYALDRALNWGYLNFTVVVDLTPPAVLDTTPRSGARVRDATVELLVILSEAGEVSYAGAPHAQLDGVVRLTVAVKDGDNDYLLDLRDLAGNTAQATVRLTGDRAAPLLAVATPQNHSVHPRGIVRVSGTTEPGAIVTVNGHAAQVEANGSFASEFALDPLQALLFVVATDEAGNSATVVLQLDGQMPADYSTLLAGLLMAGMLAALAFVALRRRRGAPAHPVDPHKGPQPLKESGPAPSAPPQSSTRDSPSRRPP